MTKKTATMKSIWTIPRFLGLIIVIAFAGSIEKLVGKSISERFFEENKSVEIDKILIKTASENNKQLPMMIDMDARLDSIISLNKRTQYNYKLVSFSSSEIDQTALRNKFAPMVRNRACISEEMKEFFKNGVTVDLVYRGKNGNSIATISVTPSQCGY